VSFSTDMAELVTGQLSRFVSLNRYQLAGQVANLDFWVAQVRHALAAIDGYGVRFVHLQSAQEAYLAAYPTVESQPCHEFPKEKKLPGPRRVPDRELQKARRALMEATSGFLCRCKKEGLISELQLSRVFETLSIE
jgi:hypothetical protein